MLSGCWLTASLQLAHKGDRHLRSRCQLAAPAKGAPAFLQEQKCLTSGQGAETGKGMWLRKGSLGRPLINCLHIE